MKIGCCASIENVDVVAAAGFDFLECTVVSLVPENDVDYQNIRKKYFDSHLPVEVCNVFLPGHLKVTGNDVDETAIEIYLSKAIPRVKEIGADTIVFGSGDARSYPENFSKIEAEKQLIRFLKMTTKHAEEHDVTIVIEPLNKKESNIINSVPEAVELAGKVDHPSIRVLADFYHMEEEQEHLHHIADAGSLLGHIHVADSDRLAPGTGTYPYETFTNNLKDINYLLRVSVECEWRNFEEEAVNSYEFLKTYIGSDNDE
ncbi:Sugar phosphate isomerase/epimerase [Gracilibacillus orientalis]|uniref:Sugar phosphate isomerase/epimerase n=1 Tax=Gracilibacillus orientalis TaxID=334253 RepID=A0A1I4JT12_9BACI|nr:sugar phosphate isomerase/epimerase family protein [Gracilibacillus orientalis]SFL69461.1 Sugar phosphate isomerase/epimerase [Gracilibacillus orientalis]